MNPKTIILAVSLMAGPVFAQEECPARVHPGTWTTTVSTIASGEVLIQNFGTIRQSTPVAARGQAVVEAGACDGDIVLQMPRLRFQMARVGGPDSPDFEGAAATGSITYDLSITVIGPDRMVGSFEATTSLRGAGNLGAQASGLTFMFDGNPSGRPECVCREQLEAWIADRIIEAEAYRDAWADQNLRQRPTSWPAQPQILETWGPRAHRRMVDMVVAGYSQEVAAEVIWNNSSTSADPIENDFSVADGLGGPSEQSATGQTPQADEEYVSETAAYVDDACTIQAGGAFMNECYPDIALEATIAHESVHVAQCEARQPIGGLAGQADREVEAYTAEAEFWRRWIPDNCG